MHSQILFPSSIPASHPLTQLTHPPPRWSGLAPPPSSQPCAPRHMPPHPWRTVGYPPQSVGQYQGRCAFTVGWVQEPTLSLNPHLSCTHGIAIAQSQTQGIAHRNTGLSSKEYHTVFYKDHKKTVIICAHRRFPSLAHLVHGRIHCTTQE